MGPDNSYWSEKYVDGVVIYNEKTWNEKLRQCPVTRKVEAVLSKIET